MENLGSILISAVLSGVFATIVTLWWQNKSRIKQEKVRIFTILMSKRYDIAAEESVEALNMIDVVFYKSSKVRTVWREFNDTTKLPESNTKAQAISDKHLRLLEVIAEDIGYKEIRWEDIKQYYYPVGLSDRKRDEAVLRRVQIDAGIAQIKKEESHQSGVSRVDSTTEMNQQLTMKALNDPEWLMKLVEAVEKGKKIVPGK